MQKSYYEQMKTSKKKKLKNRYADSISMIVIKQLEMNQILIAIDP